MQGFDVERDAYSLTLTRRSGPGQWWRACGLVGASAMVVVLLGVFAMVRALGDGGPPRMNEFVWLWTLGVLAVAVLIPLYAWRALLCPTIIRFDSRTGTMSYRGRPVTSLRSIERLRVSRTPDCDGRTVYELAVLHTDGHEFLIDRTYDEAAIWIVGHEMADYLGVEIES